MATNYTLTNFSGPDGKKYLILQTQASNIQLVSTYKNGVCSTVAASNRYGMNASFFNSDTNKAILNIAIQDGSSAGTGQLVRKLDSEDEKVKDGTVNLIGASAISWNGSALNCLNDVQLSTDSRIPKTLNSWAQGGIGLYLCNSAWKSRYLAEYSAETYLPDKTAARTGILINKSTKYVYLFACASNISVSDLRAAMMSYAKLTEGGNPGSWAAIMTDGGRSTQLYSGEGSIAAALVRGVPQIIALKNKT